MASVKDMTDWGFNLESCRKISADDFENLVRNDCKPLIGDILIAKDGSYLKHIFRITKDNDLVILSSIAIIRPSDSLFTNYLVFMLKDNTVKSRLKGFVSGAALPRIILKDFRKFRIIIPPQSVLKDFSEVAEPVLKSCEVLGDKNNNLRKTRDLLLPKLMSGEIDVEDMDIEINEE